MDWLIEESALDSMRAAAAVGNLPTAEQEAEYEARARGGEGILSVSGDKAVVQVQGVLTQRKSFFAMLFGGGNTTYSEINDALAAADKDPDVSEITLAIDSPGGQIAGLFDTIGALEAVKKPVHAVVNNVGASAAYAIASQADTITAVNRIRNWHAVQRLDL